MSSNSFVSWWRKPSRIQVAINSRAARKVERRILGYPFPAHLEKRVREELPGVDERGFELIEQGLREWFVCCAWRGNRIVGMPSRAVDEAWHAFILDTSAYISFCQAVFGQYLHHAPDETMSTPMPEALAETVRAWDRSDSGHDGESVLWDLDRKLGIGRPFAGMRAGDLESARTRAPYPIANGWLATPAGGYYAGGCGGGGYMGGGDGGGCGGGGGGCGGGGGGGGN